MQQGAATELLLIRHAPGLGGGRLAGRRDVAADCSDLARIAAVRDAVGAVSHVVTSPAMRCRQTAAALWPDGTEPDRHAALWEQDFGDWEGVALGDLPDLGPLSPVDLAAHRPPGGESFADLCARVAPALGHLADGGGRVAVVAHAGVVRAGLALALGSVPLGLRFEVAPLSVTILRAFPGAGWSVAAVNWTPA